MSSSISILSVKMQSRYNHFVPLGIKFEYVCLFYKNFQFWDEGKLFKLHSRKYFLAQVQKYILFFISPLRTYYFHHCRMFLLKWLYILTLCIWYACLWWKIRCLDFWINNFGFRLNMFNLGQKLQIVKNQKKKKIFAKRIKTFQSQTSAFLH